MASKPFTHTFTYGTSRKYGTVSGTPSYLNVDTESSPYGSRSTSPYGTGSTSPNPLDNLRQRISSTGRYSTSNDYMNSTYTPPPLSKNKDVAQFVEIARKLQAIDLDAVQKSFESFQSGHEDGNSKEEVIKLKEAYGVLEETCKNFEKKCMQAVEDKSEYEEKFIRIKDELRIKEKEVEHLERVVVDKDRDLKHMAKDKESALSRLSKEMGDKLSQDNPAIADLSDPNRSTKIAEMYNSIYDNEWTDALETLQSTRLDEENAVISLLEIMKTIYEFCSSAKKEHVEQLENHLLRPMSKREAWSEENPSTKSSQKQIRSLLMECIKLGAKDMIPSLQKSYLSMRSKAMYAEQIPEYVQKVMELCWLMNMCNPPLVFGDVPRTGEQLDKDYYKEYTKQGDIVSFVVWFPLLIQENGPVLTKGVAQPIPSEAKLSRSSVKERSRKDLKDDWYKPESKAYSSRYSQEDKTRYRPGEGEETSKRRSDYKEDVVSRLFESNKTGGRVHMAASDGTTIGTKDNLYGHQFEWTDTSAHQKDRENIPSSDFMKSYRDRSQTSRISNDQYGSRNTQWSKSTSAGTSRISNYVADIEAKNYLKYDTSNTHTDNTFSGSNHWKSSNQQESPHIDNIEYKEHKGNLVYRNLPDGKWCYVQR
ncbi:uncharacterized protein [Mytilus edulis]|uniref:uncharacterized protein n=1 Tax=Mytilus edulis TaxID=6550 RepID=UPI0039EF7665